ncbi:thioredoxin-2-like protein [Leptotrombidium deliense]|uniref:Thioredoxin n=1 Tax=Leptotrombidium deliense TaxID=299467 RepID=A0A443S1Z5_9ACAR|nr:thioredoxin-2-like protein [Leptotrombidium deliense]
MGKVTHIKNADELKGQLEGAGNKLVVIDFFATWCGPCKAIAPIIEKMATEFEDSVVFLKVDVDECESVAASYNISAMPTFKFIKEKKEVDEFMGANEAKIKELVQKHK